MPTSIITRGSGVLVAGRRSRGLSPAFSRASAGYQSDGRKVGVGVPRFETVDGKAVLVEEGTTNSLTTPLIDAKGTGWYTEALLGNGQARLSMGALIGQYSLELLVPFSNQQGGTDRAIWRTNGLGPCLSSTTYTCSGWVTDPTKAASVQPQFYDDVEGKHYRILAEYTGQSVQNDGMTWYRAAKTFTTTANPRWLWFRFSSEFPNSTGTWRACGFQLETKPYATSFADGTRAAESLSIPTAELLSVQEGSVECWARPNWSATAAASNKVIVSAFSAGASNGAYWFGYSATQNKWGVPDAGLYSGVQTFAAQTRFYLVLTWDSATLKLYMNGSLVGTAAKPANFALAADGLMRIGGFVSGNYQFDGLINGLRIYRRALTADEIAAHAAGGIVAADCYHYAFDGDLWPAPGSLGAVVAPAVTTRPGRVDVITRRGSVDIITRPGKLEVIRR